MMRFSSIRCCLSVLAACFLATFAGAQTTFYWDADGTITDNDAGTGANLGGTGAWNTSSLLWWNLANDVAWPNLNTSQAVFTGAQTALPTLNTITVGSGILANNLTFVRGGYTLNGGDLTLAGTTPGIYVNAGEMVTINTVIKGTDGFTKSGGGAVNLGSAANTYTGVTTISNGTVVIGGSGALGADTSTVMITGASEGGSLLLAGGYNSGFTLTRNLSISGGSGAGGSAATLNGGALVSVGDNSITGQITSAAGTGSTYTGMASALGMLTVGDLAVQGSAATNFTTFGSGGSIGSYALTGILSGTGSIQKTGGGTLLLTPSSTSGFSGTLRVSLGSVRIASGAVLGTNTGTTTASTIELNGGTLEVRSDLATTAIGKTVYMSNGSTLFADHALGGRTINGLVTFGNMAFLDNETLTLTSRNGYAVTMGSAQLTSTAAGPTTFTNSLTGLLTIGGNLWNYGETGTARVFTFGGNGDTLVTGNVLASGNTHGLTKSGSGTLTLNGTASTYTGTTAISGGVLAINDFRAVTNNTATINIGSTTTAATLTIGTTATPTLAGLTTSKVINLSGTTGGATINASQAGVNPVVLNGNVTAGGAGTKSLTLSGSSTLDNVVNGVISNNSAANITILRKTDAGTWVLAGTNTFTGSVQIAEGTLKVRDTFSGGSRNVVSNTSALGFIADVAASGTAGGSFEYVGAAGSASSEQMGPVMAAAGAGTIRVTAGAGGTANLLLASVETSMATTAASSNSTTITVASTAGLVPGMRVVNGSAAATISSITNGTQVVLSAAQTLSSGAVLTFDRPNGGGTVNFVPGTNATVTLGSVSSVGLLNNYSYFNGADFAYASATTNAVLRAPVYDTDPGFVTAGAGLTSGSHNLAAANTSSAALTILSLKISGSPTLTQTGLLTIRSGAAGTSGSILATGGSSILAGTGVTTGGAADLIIRVNGGTDTLTLNAPVTSTTTGGLTKTGAGVLVIGGVNAQTGTTTISEGTLQLATGGRLSAASAALVLRQGAFLDLNGVTTQLTATTTSISSFNGSGTVRNTSPDPVLFAVGGGTTGGTGTFSGTINETAGRISVIKMGTSNSQTWSGVSNYTGSTRIGVPGTATSGSLTVTTLAPIGVDSSIGRGDSTSLATNQGSLIFGGSTAGLIYTGTRSVNTDRLFTMAGTGASAGATITNNAVNGQALSFTNPGPIAFAAASAQHLQLAGSSTSDNWFDPLISDSGTGTNITRLTKSGDGVWILGNSSNSYTGLTTVSNGILRLGTANSLPAASPLVLASTTTTGVLETSGAFNRTLGTGAGNLNWVSGGFSASDSKLTVNITGSQVWNSSANFVLGNLVLSSVTALSEVELTSGFEITTGSASAFNATTTADSATVTLTSGTTAGLAVGQEITGNPNIPAGRTVANILSATQFTLNSSSSVTAGTGVATNNLAGGYRAIVVNDNTSTFTDFATISGAITGTGTLAKEGTGLLQLFGANTYAGQTVVRTGTLAVLSLGDSALGAGATSVGQQSGANLAANGILLGNGSTGAGTLNYVGTGEVSDRAILFNTTTGDPVIVADGSGPLVLTNVQTAAGPAGTGKVLILRGANTLPNQITSNLTNDSGGNAVALTHDSAGTWILSGNNSYTGVTTVGVGGYLGAGSNTAFGAGGLVISNATVFAQGGDRVLSLPVTETNGTGYISTFMGDYSLTFDGAWTNPTTSASGRFLRNNIVAGKTLTINGDYTFTAVTTGTNVSFDGSGDTIINGVISNALASTTTIGITYSGTGSLTLGGANTYDGNTVVASGTLKLGADEVIPHGTDVGNVVFNPALGVTATLNLNGRTETLNGLSGNAAGDSVIDNLSSTPATLIVGGFDQTSTFGGGLGTYKITDTGTGALSLAKIGAGTMTIPAGATLSYQGTTQVTGGTLSIASPVNGTSGLSVTGAGSVLALTGGITNPAAVLSIAAGEGSTLTLLDGAGSQFNLNSLTLGSSGGTMTTLNLNVGDLNTVGDGLQTDTLKLLTGGTLNLFAGNQITLNLTDAGLNANQTYTLINIVDGGLTTGPLTALDYILGGTPGGFSSITINRTNNIISITTGNLITGALYWRGVTDTTWNANANNWATTKAGGTPGSTIPGQGTDVIFVSDPVTGALVTTLEQNFKINSLTFEASTTPANTPASVTINPGTVATNRLEIAPQNATDGIRVTAGGPASVTIATAVKLGGDQTWEVADGGSTLTLGGLQGVADVTKTGAGRVVLNAAADSTFNTAKTADFTISAGTLEMTNLGALGTAGNDNLARVAVGGPAVFFYNNATTGVVPLPLTLNGGTLSVGGAAQTYSGNIAISAASTINMRDLNSATLTATQRNITLSGVLSGAGKLTVDSINTVTAGNMVTGTLTLGNANAAWSGGINLVRGVVAATNVSALGTGPITASAGRIFFNTVGGTTFNLAQNITVDGVGAVLELSADASSTVSDMTVNLGGIITLGSNANANAALRLVQATDNVSVINITNSVVLGNNASISTSGSTTRPFVISGVISETGGARVLSINDDQGAWAQTNQTLRLEGANTFTGDLVLGEGALEFSTVSNIGGGPSNLGQGSALTIGTGTLRFIGSANQSTNRPITQTASSILGAAGTGGATITYTAAITAAGFSTTLTGNSTSGGIITGGITQTGTSADLLVTSGTWTFSGAQSTIGDDFKSIGAGTVLNLNSSNLLAWGAGSTSNFLYANNGGVINLGANDVSTTALGLEGVVLGIETAGAAGVMNMNGFNLTVPRLDIGAASAGLEGQLTGTGGTLTVTGNVTDYSVGIRTFRGLISANLAGAASFLKQGQGEVILSGDNSGLTGTVATRIDAGTLVLDYSTSNASKLSTAAALDIRAATLTLNGGILANTVQNIGFGLVEGGSSVINVNSVGAFTTTLNVTAATRVNAGGLVRINLDAASGLTTTVANNNLAGMFTSNLGAAFLTIKNASGTFFATNDGAGNLVPLTYTAPKTDVTTWTAFEHVTDGGGGYTGATGTKTIGSLRFDTAASSAVSITASNWLNIASGGILVTENAASGALSISGGTLLSGAGELALTHDGAATLTISSTLRGATFFTKGGTGTVVLSGNNTNTSAVTIAKGTLRISGGDAIGDRALVELYNDTGTTFDLNNNSETIGGLAGGGTTGGVVAMGAATLTINAVNGTLAYAGIFTGSGTIIKTGASSQEFEGNSTGFTGNVIINQGLLHLDSTSGALINATSFVLNGPTSSLLSDQEGDDDVNRIGDNVPIFLNNTGGGNGLRIRNDNDQGEQRTETVGAITLGAGSNVIWAEQSNAATNTRARLVASMLTRTNQATVLMRGENLGATTGLRGLIVFTNVPGGAIGSAATSGTALAIYPYMVGDASAGSGLGNSFVYYDPTTGIRPLNTTTEYVVNETAFNALAAVTSNNVRFATSPVATLTGGSKTINSLVLDSTSAALVVNGPAGDLTLGSGALLGTGANEITLGGYTNLLTSTSEYVIYSTAAGGKLTLQSALTTTGASLTKSGIGNLVLENAGNSYTGGTWFNQGTIEVPALAHLGTGALNFFGGGLRWATGATFDPTSRSLVFGLGGATFDTNGNDVTLAGSLGTGAGGFTKTGAGVLTVNGVAYTGSTTVTGGTLRLGSSGALSLADLIVNGGTLDINGFNPTFALVTLGTDVNSLISGLGTLTSNNNIFDVQAGTISAILAGTSRLVKSGSGTVVLSGQNTYTGLTEISAGVLEVSSLDNLGAGASIDFDGGTLRWAAGSTFDPSARPIRMFTGIVGFDTNGNDVTMASSIGYGGAGGLTKLGLGTLTLGGANNYTGSTLVSAGILRAANNRAFGDSRLVTIDNTGSILELADGVTLANAFAIGGTGNEKSIVLQTGATTATISGTIGIVETTGGNFRVDSNGGTLTFSGAVTGTGGAGLRKIGNGTLILTAANTYTGVTQVFGGTLQVNSGSNISVAATTVQEGVLDLRNSAQSITTLTMGNGAQDSTSKVDINGGALTLGGTVTYTASTTSGTATIEDGTVNLGATRTFAVNDSTNVTTTREMVVDAVVADGAAASGITKTGNGTLVFSRANTYTGATTVAAGSLIMEANQVMTGGLIFGAASTAGFLDLSNSSAQFSTLSLATNSTTLTNSVQIGAGKTLTLTGNVTVGANIAASTTRFSASGDGAFVNTNIGGTFQVGGATGGTNTNAATGDFSALATFTVDLGSTGTFRVGDNNTVTSGVGSSTLLLGAASTITAGTLQVASSTTNASQVMRLGSGTNILNVNTLTVGGVTRANGTVNFNTSTGTLKLRAADGTGATAVNLGNTAGNTANNQVTLLDLTGHSSDLLVSDLVMADRSLNTGSTTATLSFDEGTLAVTSWTMARRTSTGTGGATATVNLGDSAAVGTPQTTIGSLTMAVNTSAGGAVSADFNVTGGTVTIGTGTGTAINMASANSGRTVTSTLDLTGGTVTVSGDIVRTGGAGTESATVTLDGASLDMTGKVIGASARVINLVAASGSLSNLAELNGGGALTKTTAGTLILGGTNTYTGGTAVSAGTLLVNGNNAGATGAVTTALNTVLGGTGTIGGNTSLAAGADLTPGDNGIGRLTINGTFSAAATSDLMFQIGGATTQDTTNVIAYRDNPGAFVVPASWRSQTSNHDQLRLTNAAIPTIDGVIKITEFLNGYSPSFGDIFYLVDWTSFNGSNSLGGTAGFDFSGISLGSGISLDTGLFASSGVLVVVPEPSRALLLFSGLVLLGLRRRRR